MEKQIQYTHELLFKGSKVYDQSVLEEKNVINSEFERIDRLNPINFSNGIKLLEVEGLMHLYGFKVENGGFYDLINGQYYPENSEVYKNGKIIEAQKPIIQESKSMHK